jgi:hypothetical protein
MNGITSADFENFAANVFAAAEPYNGQPCLVDTYRQDLEQELEALEQERQAKQQQQQKQKPSPFDSKMSIINELMAPTKKPAPELNLVNSRLFKRREEQRLEKERLEKNKTAGIVS